MATEVIVKTEVYSAADPERPVATSAPIAAVTGLLKSLPLFAKAIAAVVAPSTSLATPRRSTDQWLS